MMSIARHHHEWLSLIETSGPFLSLPVLLRAFPQGLDQHDPELRQRLRNAYETWLDNQYGLRPSPQIHHSWVQWVLSEVLGLEEQVLRDLSGEGADDPTLTAAVTVKLDELGETLQPDFVVVEPINILSPPPPDRFAPRPRLLVQVAPHDQALERPLAHSHSQASPATRMMELLHATGVRLGLVTNGAQWLLVDAPKGETTGYTSWYADYWLEEPLTLRAFRTLLHARRFFGVPAPDTIEALLAESVTYQQEVTDQLGLQVRHAVELLVQAMDKADHEAGRRLLADLHPGTLYEAAVTVMMRLVFLLCAEERDLLPLNDPLYSQYYAVSTLQAQLRKLADQTGEEVLEYRYDAWPRLLATCRAVHGGLYHDRLHLPAYGGGLFDPERFPFLEGWDAGGGWRVERNSPLTTRHPLRIDNRTVLHLLEALQLLQVKLPGGGPSEARRVSFRALDIEQIGYVYEGLLDHTARRAETLVLGLAGAKERAPEVPLSTLAALLPNDNHVGATANLKSKIQNPKLLTFLQEQTGRAENALRKALGAPAPDLIEAQRLRAACNNDETLYQSLLPWHALIRTDDYGRPVVIHGGSFYVTAGAERRATGAHYTPRSLTEPIVQHTLEPLVYVGPAEGKPRSAWRLRTPAELLHLKICDMAMGSGAFLVQTTRYLADRLLEAWELYDLRKNSSAPATPKEREILGDALRLRTAEESQERQTLARRLVADRCLYGVDKNPLAVEMAKLSLWLITMDKGKPFTFLDHALKCGDSLVGVNLEQLYCWNLEGKGQRQFDTLVFEQKIQEMVKLRLEIEEMPVLDILHQQTKSSKLANVEMIADEMRRISNDLVAIYCNEMSKAQQVALNTALLAAHRDKASVEEKWRQYTNLGSLRPFHWMFEFPEVFLDEGREGFDAFVGNPPFLGGRYISGHHGNNYLQYLKTAIANRAKGNADIVVYFLLKANYLLRQDGLAGFISTKTIAEGDTHDIGLAQLISQGSQIHYTTIPKHWPGDASVMYVELHWVKGLWRGKAAIDGQVVNGISSRLDSKVEMKKPNQLYQEVLPYQGSYVHGAGFLLTTAEYEAIVQSDPLSQKCIFPCLSAEDFNTSPIQEANRGVIYFGELPMVEASTFKAAWKHVELNVKGERLKLSDKYLSQKWWLFKRPTKPLYDAIWQKEYVLVCPVVTKYLSFAWINSKVILLNKMVTIQV